MKINEKCANKQPKTSFQSFLHKYNNITLIIFFCLQFPITALREIRILQLLKHENVVNLIEICRTRGRYLILLCNIDNI